MFSGSLRAFLFALFGTLGVICAVLILFVGLGGLISLAGKESYGSGVKLLPDAEGNRKKLSMDVPVILEIPIKGMIGVDSLTESKIENVLLKSREKKFKKGRVKGILLTINSPGGGVNASDQIFHLLEAYKKQYDVPIYAYIDGLCASGGYYIACASDKIYASDVSLIGSVGVLSWPPFMNVTDALEKIGVETMTLYAGKGKDAMNPFRPWKEGEQERYQKLIDYFYTQFVAIVTKARPQVGKEKLIETYGANVFPAPQALQDGYIDVAEATRREVLKALTIAAGIAKGSKYQVVSLEKKTFWKRTFESRSPLLTGKLKHAFDIPKKWQCQDGIPLSYLYE